MRFAKIILVLTLFVFLSYAAAYAQTPTASQTAGGVMRQQQDMRKMKALEKEVTTPRAKTEKLTGPEQLEDDTGEKILIKTIIVENVTLVPQETIAGIIANFEGKELSMKGMQMAADLITDEYRKKGYATSRAYIPPQSLNEGTLTIRVVEGKLGAVEIKGNRYFKTALIKKMLDLPKDGYFDYSALQESLTYINEHPDRNAKAVLVPGQEPGTTDIVIDVKDRLPIHFGFNYDNYLSQYLGNRRLTYGLEHNNLLGFDDKMLLGWQESSDARLRNFQLSYTFPVKRDFNVGFAMSNSSTNLGREFEAVEARGEALLLSVFTNKVLVNTDNFDLRWNTGFDYKEIANYLLGSKTSQDDIRIAKTGLDIDFNDAWGRNIIVPEVDFGIPNIMGGMDSKDDFSSRALQGSGGQFTKWLVSYFRLQPGPVSSEILLKSSFQFSNNNLPAGEQFQIGGPGSVRGYPMGEYSADKGLYAGVDWAVPVYFLPKNWKVPFMKERTFYESLRLVSFYDWGETQNNRAAAGDEENHTLSSWGLGFRMNFGENLFARVEFGVPISHQEPTNAKNIQPWFEVVSKF
jgi:hemolysin activation/secretion protein